MSNEKTTEQEKALSDDDIVLDVTRSTDLVLDGVDGGDADGTDGGDADGTDSRDGDGKDGGGDADGTDGGDADGTDA